MLQKIVHQLIILGSASAHICAKVMMATALALASPTKQKWFEKFNHVFITALRTLAATTMTWM